MFNKESQYINVIKYDTQLKIDFKKLKNDNMLFGEESTFVIRDEILSRDIATKLNYWQKAIPKTYISTLCLCDDEKIIKKFPEKKLKEYERASLNDKFDVVVKNSKLFEVKHYFESSGLDFVYSPFHVLNLHLEQNPSKSALLVLTINSHIYIVIVDDKSQIVYSKVIKLTKFSDIQESNFYDSAVVGQKLYDEVYSLELQNAITKVIKDFYSLKHNVFIEKIDILYSLKQLSDEQVELLSEELLIPIHYHHISIKESLYELTRSTSSLVQSYIKPRFKKSSSFLKVSLTASLLLVFALVLAIFFKDDLNNLLEEKKEKEEILSTFVINKEASLPNHIDKNNSIKKDIKTIMNTIPYDMVLNSLEIKKDNSTISGKILKPDSYLDMKVKILKLYKYSNIQIEDSKNVALKATIYNNDAINQNYNLEALLPKYINDGFIPVQRVTEQLKILLPNSSVLRYDSTFNSKITTFNYKANIVVDEPRDFFNLVDDLNRELYSINITYPLRFTKLNNKIEIDFVIQFHQY